MPEYISHYAKMKTLSIYTQELYREIVCGKTWIYFNSIELSNAVKTELLSRTILNVLQGIVKKNLEISPDSEVHGANMGPT